MFKYRIKDLACRALARKALAHAVMKTHFNNERRICETWGWLKRSNLSNKPNLNGIFSLKIIIFLNPVAMSVKQKLKRQS